MNDKGFFAMVPRIVRTGYKHLSHACKWLYACLTDLCGKSGECFRSLRSLAQETGISTGSLSKMIPRLAAAGLIQDAKGRKNMYHIRIVSIWKQNVQFCSNSEQKESSNCPESNPLTVQNMNKNVQNLGTFTPDSSQNLNTTVQNLDTEEESPKQILNSKDKPEEDMNSSPSTSLSVSLSGEESSVGQLRQWIKEYNAGQPIRLKIYASKDKVKEAADLALLVPRVHGINDVKALYNFVKADLERRNASNKTVFLGNMAGSAEDWVKSRGYVPSEQGMSEVECSTLIDEIWNYDADIGLSYRDNNDRWFVAVFTGDGRYFELGSPDDWAKIPVEWLAQAIQYGRDLALGKSA